jgi:hypothetical protein
VNPQWSGSRSKADLANRRSSRETVRKAANPLVLDKAGKPDEGWLQAYWTPTKAQAKAAIRKLEGTKWGTNL